MKRKVMKITACVFLLLIIIGVIFISMYPSLPEKPSKGELISFFNKNKTTFESIGNYLSEINSDISIDKRDGKDINSITKIVTKEGTKAFILDDAVKDDVKRLLYR